MKTTVEEWSDFWRGIFWRRQRGDRYEEDNRKMEGLFQGEDDVVTDMR